MANWKLPTLSGLIPADDANSNSAAVVRDPQGDIYGGILRGANGVRNAGHRYSGVVAKSATFTVDEAGNNGEIYQVDSTAGSVTVNLPSAATSTGKIITVLKTVAANSVILDGASTETINGATTLTLSSQYAKATIYCDGTAWYQIG